MITCDCEEILRMRKVYFEDQSKVSVSRSVVSHSATPWTVACHAPLSVEFSRQEYCSGLPCSLLGDLPEPAIESTSFMSPAFAGRFLITRATWEALG